MFRCSSFAAWKCLSKLTDVFIVHVDAVMSDPLEGSSTTLFSVPGPRRSSRLFIGTSLPKGSGKGKGKGKGKGRGKGVREGARGGPGERGGLRSSRSRSPLRPSSGQELASEPLPASVLSSDESEPPSSRPVREGRRTLSRTLRPSISSDYSPSSASSSDDDDDDEPTGKVGRAREGRRSSPGRSSLWTSDSSPSDSSPSSAASDDDESSSSSEDEDKGKKYPHPRTYEDTILCAKWRKHQPAFTKFAYAGPQPGPSVPVARNTSALDLFCRFFTSEVWDLLVEETNRQAQALDVPKWVDIAVVEMKAFIGLLIVMGILKLPRLELYWTRQHPLLHTHLRDVMPKERFLAILRALHLNDSSLQVPIGQPGYDPLFKVRKLLDVVLPRFEDQFNLNEEVSIDEAMIPFKGKLGFKQYMKDKPTKWGIKVFVLADARTGYTKRIQIYTGKSNNLSSAMDGGLTTRVVLDLVKGLEEDHIKLFVDNYYTSPSLFMKLYRKGVNACGTLRPNRTHFPKQLVIQKGKKMVKVGQKVHNQHRTRKPQKVDRGYISHRASGPLLASVWVDKRVIYFLTTMHCAEPNETVSRTAPGGRKVDRACPSCLPDYQKFMRGVDRGDQLEGYYSCGRRSEKWWKRVFTYIIEASILNAYILDAYRPPAAADDSSSSPALPHHQRDSLHFRLALANQLVGDYSGKKRVGRPSVSYSLRRDRSTPHFPMSVSQKRRCTLCLSRHQRCETKIQCTVCKIHLCILEKRNCFYEYHTLQRV